MEEKEMNKKNKTVFIVIIIILVILLCVGAFFLGRWITNKETNNETNNPIEVSDVLESVLPSVNITSSVLYTEEDIDAYEFFEQNMTSYFDTGNAEFIKIENNKLMWNINNVWVYDEVITDDVAIVDLEEHSGSGWFTGYILTTNYNLYYVSIDNVDAINIYPELIDGKPSSNYIISNQDIINIKEINFPSFDIKHLRDENDNYISAKYIVKVNSNNEIYYIIVDISDNLYSIKESDIEVNKKIKLYKRCESVETSFDEMYIERIVFEDGEEMVFN